MAFVTVPIDFAGDDFDIVDDLGLIWVPNVF